MASSTGGEPFGFEEEEAFRLAMEIADLADAVAMRVRRDRPWAASQLGRSSLSIVANTAILKLLARKGVVPADTERQLRALLLNIIQMLTRRAIYFQRRAGSAHN